MPNRAMRAKGTGRCKGHNVKVAIIAKEEEELDKKKIL